MEKYLNQLQDDMQILNETHLGAIKGRDVYNKQTRDARAQAYKDLKGQADAIAKQIEVKRTQMKMSSSEYERITEEIRQISAQVAGLRVKQSSIQTEVNTLQLWVQQAQKAIEDVADLRSDEADRSTQIAKMESAISQTRDDLLVLNWFNSNIPYIKLHRLSLTMSELSEKVNHHLAEMGDTVRVNISSFEEKKSTRGAGDSKDLLKSDVKVEVVDGEKNIDPRLYSDGETAKISNALIRALHEMALRGGHGCNVILLDEIFAFVDLTNSQRVVDSLASICASTTLVTDNSGHVNDLLPFSEVWVARKQNGITTLGAQS